MKTVLRYFLIGSLLAFLSVSVMAQQVWTYVSGTLTNPASKELTLVYYAEGQDPLGSGNIDENGKFVLQVNVPATDIFKLQFKDGMYLTLVLNPGDSVIIEADLAHMLETLSIKGSEESALIYNTEKSLQVYTAKKDSINNAYEEMLRTVGANDSVQEYFRELYMDAERQSMNVLVDVIAQNPNYLSCLFFIDRLDMDEYFDSYKILDAELFKLFPQNKYVEGFHTRVEGARKLAVNEMAPEIALPDPDGNVQTLSSLKGKLVLIDFWASWCSPCRKENPNMVRIYNKFKDKGFTVFSVSLDKSKDSWVKAIKDDGLTWTHVSDLKYWQSEAAASYQVSAVPYTVLVGQDGRILAKGLRGEPLEKKIEEILK